MLDATKRPDRKITEVKRVLDGLILYSEDGTMKLEPMSPDIIRIVYTKKDTFVTKKNPGIVPMKSFNQWNVEELEQEIRLVTSRLFLRINRASASIGYYKAGGRLLLQEREFESKDLVEFDSYKGTKDGNSKLNQIETPDGIKEVVTDVTKVFDQKLYKTRLHLNWQDGEALYGLGQQEEGNLNLRGQTVYLHQANKKIAVPLLVSSFGYGILMDTYSPMIFSDTSYGSYLYTEADLEMDYYFIHGETMDGVIKGYRNLTGKAVMLPKWAFGFIQSQERYETADELIHVVEKYRECEIGLDGIVLDWCSWEGDLWGQKSFDPKRFKDPKAMMEKLHEIHANLMISVWPNMSKDGENYKEFEKENLLLPLSSIYDPYQEEGRKLYWEQAQRGLFCHGIDAWWCDSSEPFTPEWNQMGQPEPSTMYHQFYETASQCIPAQLTNSYGLFHARTMYEGQRSQSNEKRVMNLTRNGYTGQQRYGTVLWSGDISATWDTLKIQIAAGLNLCASGLPYWTLDIGGFFVKKGVPWYWNGDYELGYEDEGYRELFTRWYQYGSFLPIFRSHGTDFRRELWNFRSPGSPFYDALVKINQLRYRLMPYLYSMAAKVWKDDSTMYRMLAFDYPGDALARETADQFLFGTSLMVCPVTNPMYFEKNSRPLEGVEKSREVYLPEGNGWYDFWTNVSYEGGQTIKADAPLDRIPLYVKAGSILPMAPFMHYVDERLDASIEVLVYPGRDALFELYEDEGNSYRYEEGQYAITRMNWLEENRNLQIHKPEGNYRGMGGDREFKIQLIGV
ncbi:glycoside hydrolase family 31 protein [Clostridium sp. E02]|uniref:glycoside hydrolase family 31 protein n=1 Tax=Clostridium sp. E02 TaxID=2487134 RepID=UPI000F527771|nr:glycoside hydrolase family 31 protein [Clostridium sp. E02]